jgi:hypothetical protein
MDIILPLLPHTHEHVHDIEYAFVTHVRKISSTVFGKLDSGTTTHVTPDASLFEPHTVRTIRTRIRGVNGVSTITTKRGNIILRTKHASDVTRKPKGKARVCIIVLKDVLWVPSAPHLLVSETKLLLEGYTCNTKDLVRTFYDEKGKVVTSGSVSTPGVGEGKTGLFDVFIEGVGIDNKGYDTTLLMESYAEGLSQAQLLHNRHHVSLPYLRKMYPHLPPDAKLGFCEACHLTRAHRRPKKGKHDPQGQVLDRVDCDLTGPFPRESKFGKKRYYSVFLDVYSRFAWVYYLRDKSSDSFFEVFKCWLAIVKLSIGSVCKVFHTDGGGEFINSSVLTRCKEEGIQIRASAPYLSGSHNPYVERKHRAIKEVAHAMRVQAGLPMEFWQEAVRYAVYLQNRTPHKALGWKTPYEILTGKKPSNKYVKTFGCAVYAHDPKAKKNGVKGEKGIYLGPDPNISGNRVYSLKRKTIIVRADCTFDETSYPARRVVTKRKIDVVGTHNQNVFVPLSKIAGLPDLPVHTEDTVSNPHEESNGEHSHFKNTDRVSEENSEVEQVTKGNTKKGSGSVSYERGRRGVVQPNVEVRRSSRNSWRQSFDESLKLPDETAPPLSTPKPVTNEQEPQFFDDIDEKQPADGIEETHTEPADGLPIDNSETSNTINYTSSDFVYCWDVEDDTVYTFNIDHRGEPTEPKHLGEAKGSEFWPEWQTAMQLEIDALVKMGTWETVSKAKVLKKGLNILPNMWVFKIKRDRGVITRFKARLTVRGNRQKKGVDYNETFAAVALMKSFRVLSALAALFALTVTQIDIGNAFLHGDLKEEVYMHHPVSFPGTPGTVLRLRKSLYGLCQSPRTWWFKLTKTLKTLGFVPLVTDPCVFIHTTSLFFIIMHVDDIVMFTRNDALRASVVTALLALFTLTDFGLAKLYIGIEIDRDTDGSLHLTQSSFIDNVTERFNLTNAASKYRTPSAPGVILSKDNNTTSKEKNDSVINFPYRSIIGALLYAAIATRPDIAHIVNALAQFSTCFTFMHIQAAKRVLLYLQRTKHKGLYYNSPHNAKTADVNKSFIHVRAFCDSDWASDPDSRKSRTAYVVYIGNSPVAWRSVSQKSVALSSCEAEFYALADVVKEVLWLKQLLIELGLKVKLPIDIYIDNQAAIALAENPVSHQRTKHIDIRYFFLREHITAGTIKLHYVNTADNPADLLTKPASLAVFEKLVSELVR